MSKQIKTSEKIIAHLAKRIDALEKLNAAYRTNGRPSEKALDDLMLTREWKLELSQYRQFRSDKDV